MKNSTGIVLLVVGIGLLIWGFNLYGSFSSHVSRVFTGSPTNKTVTVLLSGAVCTALGLFQITRKSR